jgi:CRISPR-associated protein Csb2
VIRFEIRFLSGRFHATPWGHHVNEGVPEWPPSPWRIARALAATMYTRCPDLDRTLALAALRLLGSPPSFTLPPATASHTRQYLSQNKLDRAGRMVFDAFVAVDRGQRIIVHWPIAPSDAERRALATMASEVSYLGRAEAWCDMRLMDEAEQTPGPNCSPSDGKPASRVTTERVLCPAEGFTEQDLCRTTSELNAEGWSDPPGTRWVFYRRPSDALTPGIHRSAPAVGASRPKVAELALGGTVLPLFTDAVLVAERIRGAVLRQADWQLQPVHYMPEARGKTNRITHVMVYAPAGFGEAERRALAAITFPKQDHKRPTPDVVLGGFGERADFAKDSALFGLSPRWRSRTPFVLPRHPRNGKDAPEEQLVQELAVWGLPAPVVVKRSEGALLFDPNAGAAAQTPWLAFRMRRPRDRSRDDDDPTAGFWGFVIEFEEAQPGPILLGYGARYGLGQFEVAGDAARR